MTNNQISEVAGLSLFNNLKWVVLLNDNRDIYIALKPNKP